MKMTTFFKAAALSLAAVPFAVSAQNIVTHFPGKPSAQVKMAQKDTEPLVIQQPDWQNGAAAFYAPTDQGFYAADDFTLTEAKEIKNIELIGYQFDDDLISVCTGAKLYIYEDANGKPAGSPGHTGTPVFSLDLDHNDPRFYVEKVAEMVYDFLIDTSGFHAEANKKYWVVFAPKLPISSIDDNFKMWNWFMSPDTNGSESVFSDVDDFLGYGLTSWYSLYQSYGTDIGDPAKALSFALYDTNLLGTKDTATEKSITVFPNPTADKFTVNTKDFAKAEVYDFSGRLLKTSASATTDISSFGKGIYNVKVTLKNGKTVTKKIIKK